ncbi:macro domain-containing protein [Enterobacter cloacae]|uniref:macro domain-containing protein n=1 Tax=Enterobacter cloacae TaxID=550 RepID=UPI000B28FC34|nr:macro domain-containing protein [Enterobacter cloacae]HCT3325317.1 macro domain-containing protein [Enterobacter cloacae]
MSDLHLILTTTQREVLDSFTRNFEGLPNCRIHQGFYQELRKHDAVVSPANSFGLMDGGFDLVLTQRFGEQLMKRVMMHIDEHYLGEQPVGTAFVIETGHPYTPWHGPCPDYACARAGGRYRRRVPLNLGRADWDP